MTSRPPRAKPTIAAFIAAAAVVAAVACGSLTGLPASLPTLADSGVVYAINGAPPGAPSALHVFTGTLLAADANFTFDVAFDINAAGAVVFLPQRAVASGLASTHSVGLQAVSGSFDAVTSAPKTGYRADTALVALPNQVVLVQSQDANACGVSLGGTTIYAKLVVTAVDAAARQLHIRYAVDPNCGFLSFAPGIPKS